MSTKKPGQLFVLFLLLLSAALTTLFIVGEDFYAYTSGAIESAAQSATLDKDDLKTLATPSRETFNTDIRFRNFFITDTRAKHVELLADFNDWGKNPIVLKPYSRGYFEVSLALPAGEYKYVFHIDGKDVLDPNNQDRTQFNGRTVCIKTIK